MLMLMLMLGIMFIVSIQPMMMVISLIIIVLLYSFVIYKIMGGYWFSYILMLVMLSGVLVVFTYMASLVPNEKFESYNFIYSFIFLFFLSLVWFYLYKFNSSYISLEIWVCMYGMFNIFMVSFLLSVMFIVVWISCMNYGALRIM